MMFDWFFWFIPKRFKMPRAYKGWYDVGGWYTDREVK